MASLLDLAQARLQGLLDIPTRAARALVNPTAFSGLLGAPTLPQQQGMTEAAYGLPARQNMSVLDPNQAAYLQGYQQGEPLAYLGMATPFAAPAAVAGAKAVAPKAGMALENYMAQQGLIQPLTAFHGTPHTIRGKFDISKVGTGEGAQAYGHGMYFAENPNVAKSYMKYEYENTPLGSAQSALNRFNYDSDAAKKEIIKDIDKLKNKTIRMGDMSDENIARILQRKQETLKILETDNVPLPPGNLYKVDIPDEYIPNMLNWDKPFKQQPKIVQNAFKEIAKQDPDLPLDFLIKGNATGGSLIQAIDKVKASEMLNSLGVKGIRYLDEGSRGSGKGTSNFVVFDPTDVKILEKNSQKVEGLLD